MPEKDDLDLLLDSALSTYADPGADSGIEQRVLASLDAARAQSHRAKNPRRGWLPWAIAIPVAACLVIWLLIGRNAHTPSAQPEIARQASPQRSVPEVANPAQTKHPSGAKAHPYVASLAARLKPCPVTGQEAKTGVSQVQNGCSGSDGPAAMAEAGNGQPLPKLDVFPTPQPLTSEEQVLADAGRSGSKAEREALLSAATQPDAPLSIAALNIPPLAPPGDSKN